MRYVGRHTHACLKQEVRVVSGSNTALNLAPFGRWTALKRRRLALRWATLNLYMRN